MPDQPTDARARLFSHFDKVDSNLHVQKWDELWKDEFLPWDKGQPNPALVDLLDERQDILEPNSKRARKKALVPGCGKGYDVLLLAAYGYDAYGLEYSITALESAKQVEKEMDGKGIYEPRAGVEKGSVTWLQGDFFKDEAMRDVKGGASFDMIYDYTFLSALPPSMRAAWSKRMAELLSPKGRLVCIEFPTYKPASTGGPPWGLPPKVYKHHLEHPGEALPHKDGDLDEAAVSREKSSIGLVQLEHFQPKRTHPIGYGEDGKITDWVGVWSH